MTQPRSGAVSYRAKVLGHGGGLSSVERVSADIAHLRTSLEAEGLTLLSAEVTRGATQSGKVGRFPLLVFCQQLLSLLEAGLQLVESLETLAEKERDTSHHQVLAQLQSGLRAGLSLSKAMEVFPQAFPPLLRAAIEASEQTGDVSQALRRFVVYETQFQTLRSRLVGALIYPAILLSLGSLVVAFLLGYVVPRFSVVFMDRLQEMPYLSGLVIRLGLSIHENPTQSAAAAVSVLVGLGLLFAHPAARNYVVGAARQFPWVGERIRAFELVRIYRSLGMLLRGGIPAVRSLEMVASVVPARSRQGIARAITLVNEGSPISVALHREGFTTVVSERLLSVGERSGKMGEMLERAADFLDAELERSVDRAVRFMEPLMMVFMGILIGGIVMLMYLPIFELANSVR